MKRVEDYPTPSLPPVPASVVAAIGTILRPQPTPERGEGLGLGTPATLM